MRSNFFKLFLLITFLFLSNSDLLAQVNWTKYPDNPVLVGQPGTWYAYTTMNSVLYNADSSRYEMWFTAGAQISYPYTIGFAWSSDGISWNVYSPNPVLTPTPASWDAYMVLAPYVLRENGQYKMWYSGCQSNSILLRIGYATSPDGINWTKHPNPVLGPGTAFWESGAVAYPCIMKYSNGYKMWYGGYSANFSQTALGYATSPDGITWERYAGNPILPPGASGQWDHVLFAPRVLFIENNYYMFYTGETILYQSDKIGLATSPDGLVWTKYPYNPVLKPTAGQWDGSRLDLGSVILDAGTLKMYYCGTPAGGTNMQLGLATSLFSPPLLPGTYTVGTGGNFATIQEAFNKLETDGVAGNVTLELIDELYTAPTDSFGFKLNGPIPGAGPNSRVTIKPAENKNVVIEGSCQFVLGFINSNYVTLDGVGLSGSTTLSVYNLDNIQYQFNDAVSFLDNSDHNIIKNCTLISDGFVKGSSGVSLFYINEAPDSNLIENNFVPRAGAGIYVAGKDQSTRAIGNIIRGNIVGSEVDSLISWGIQDQNTQNSIIEKNIVQNINRQWNLGYYTPGINTAYSSGVVIRNNVVSNINSGNVWGSVGILVSGETWAMGSNNSVYNNMVYDIQCSSTNGSSRLAGIQLFNQTNPKVYYNSVYLTGTGNGGNPLGSAALYIKTGVTNADFKNNILVNTRDESPYCASAIYDYTASNLTSDYNDLYYDDTNNNNCLVRIGGTEYNTLAEWQPTGKDMHSYVEMPHFVEPYLHIDSTIATFLEARGTPIAEVTSDFDGQSRNALTPDIGADEMNGVVDVEDRETLPTEFTLEQNYPNPFNPTTTFRYSIPTQSKVVIKIFDILGNEIATLLNEEKTVGTYEFTWNAASLPSGVYFYQLQAGSFVETKKMILLK